MTSTSSARSTESPAPPAASAVALGAGVLGAVQPKVNAELGGRLGSGLLASLVNFGAAFAVVLVALAVRPSTRAHLRAAPSWPVPRWSYGAGVGGAVVVLSGVVSVDTIGVAAFSVAFFSGQVAFGLVLDRVGLAPGGTRALTRLRVGAAVLAVLAVAVSQLGRPVADLEPGLVGFVFLAGAASALQASANGRIVVAVGDPVAATALNVAVGLVVLALVVAAQAASGTFDGVQWPGELWLYAGGVLGVTIVLSLAIATAALGVLRSTVLMLAAQLLAAFVVDWIVHDDGPRAGTLVGAALVVVAVVLIRRPTVDHPR